jgi:hypothetical protein
MTARNGIDAPADPTSFETALAAIPVGYSEGRYGGRRYGVTVQRSADGKRTSLFARDLAGTDIVSFNLYRLTSERELLKPCEMSSEKVVSFVLAYVADAAPDAPPCEERRKPLKARGGLSLW